MSSSGLRMRKLLADYHLKTKYAETKEWYDGYRFGIAFCRIFKPEV